MRFHKSITPFCGLLSGAPTVCVHHFSSANAELDCIPLQLPIHHARGTIMRKVTRAALGMFLGLSLSGMALAAAPATGLGQAWPNAADVSASPNWHVYVFVLNGIKYIQVNDRNGNVIGAVGTAGGQFITLPVGRFSQYVSTPQQHPATASQAGTGTPTTVYKDDSTVITATPQSTGVTTLKASPAVICTDPAECSGFN